MRINAGKLSFDAQGTVGDQIETLGRTEDIKFSPGRNRLAVTEFEDNQISLFDIEVGEFEDSPPRIVLTGHMRLRSPAFAYPHGISFIDDDTAVIANRNGAVNVIEIPSGEATGGEQPVSPMAVLSSGRLRKFNSPGSVIVHERKPGVYQLLVGNNYIHRVTSHRIDLRKGIRFGRHRVLLERGLNIPDGLCLSSGRKWLAVSNHSSHEVFVYDYTRHLGKFSKPDATLKGVSYPHGLKFTADGRFLLVADAGAPLVHVFETDGSRWEGVYRPVRSVCVMDDETFERGHYNEKEGGPKGLDINEECNVLVTSCAYQPLAFFRLDEILGEELETGSGSE